MVIKSWGRRGKGGEHTWIWIYNGSQQADRVLSSTKMSPAGNGTENRIEPQPQPHQRHMRWPQLINSLNASVERETERGRKGESEWEGEQTRINEGYATGTGLDRTARYAHEIQYLFFGFFLRGMLHYMRCLSPSLSLFLSIVLFR